MPETKSIDELVSEVKNTWTELREAQRTADAEVKRHGEVLGDTTAKITKLNDAISQLETAFNARMDAVEAAGKRPAGGGSKADPDREQKRAAYAKFLRKGDAHMPELERKFLAISDDTTGGYLADDEMVQEIIKGAIEFSPMRSIARVRTTSQRAVKIRKRTGTFAAVWVGAERVTKTETVGLKYGLEEIPNHELYALVDLSNQDLEDSSFDVESELNMEFGEQFGVAEADSFVNGTGVGEPEGFMSSLYTAAEDFQANGHATVLKQNGVIDLVHSIKSSYARNAQIVLNRSTLGAVRKLADTTEAPIWVPFSAGNPATIVGVSYTEFPDMPNVGSGTYPMAIADWRRAYLVVDRVQIAVLRDPYSQATEGAVRFIARKRVGGQVVLREAIKRLKMAV